MKKKKPAVNVKHFAATVNAYLTENGLLMGELAAKIGYGMTGEQLAKIVNRNRPQNRTRLMVGKVLGVTFVREEG